MKKIIALLILVNIGAAYADGGRSPREVVIEMERTPNTFFPTDIDEVLIELGNDEAYKDEAYIERLELRAKHPKSFDGYKPLPGQDVIDFITKQHRNIQERAFDTDHEQLIDMFNEIEQAAKFKKSSILPRSNISSDVKTTLNKMLNSLLTTVDQIRSYKQSELERKRPQYGRAGGEAGPAEVETAAINYGNLRYGVAEAIGMRKTMEDATTEVVAPNFAIFGLYDGHGGSDVSKFVANNMPGNIINHPEFQIDPKKVLFDAYIKTDAEIPQDIDYQGCTAVTALFKDNKLYVASSGDSRAVLSRSGQAIAMSEDQSPEVPTERARIEALGGKVTIDPRVVKMGGVPLDKEGKIRLFPYRVNGLNMARALGDKASRPFVIPDPEVKVIELKPEDEFLILACDGIWDYMEENQEAINQVNILLSENQDLSDVAQGLITYVNKKARNDLGHDNMSVIIIDLRGLIK